MSRLSVLVACEESGTVRDAFIARGHNAWSCDLKPSLTPGPHLKSDVVRWLTGQPRLVSTLKPVPWDLLICHPPCTYLCGSGMHWTTRGLRDPKLTSDAIEFAETLWNCGIEKICLENPVGVLSTRSNLGKPSQIIQPYEFGEDASKKTCLWLKNLPILESTEYFEPRMVCKACGGHNGYAAASRDGCRHCGAEAAFLRPRWSNQTDSGQNKLGPSANRAAARAQTYRGIARAMAEQWSEDLKKV